MTGLFFLPAMIGLSVSLVAVKGPAMLILFPLVRGFIVMVTALTYQFRGWLATLMVNKRRRRAIVMLVMVVFMLVMQLPVLVNMTYWRTHKSQSQAEQQRWKTRFDKLAKALDAGEIDIEQYRKQLEAQPVAGQTEQNLTHGDRFE